MAERDAWWSIYLYSYFGNNSNIDRIVDWAWSDTDYSSIDEESLRLCGIILAWFLTTSQRLLRDRATKALVKLLTDKIDILMAILKLFKGINDTYVYERLMAVAYGCVMRNRADKNIQGLAQYLFDELFSKNSPPPHILLRDYARGVIELAVNQGFSIEGDLEKIFPPYTSGWVEIPDKDEINSLKIKPDENSDPNYYSANNWIVIFSNGLGLWSIYIKGRSSYFQIGYRCHYRNQYGNQKKKNRRSL